MDESAVEAADARGRPQSLHERKGLHEQFYVRGLKRRLFAQLIEQEVLELRYLPREGLLVQLWWDPGVGDAKVYRLAEQLVLLCEGAQL